MMPIPFDPWPGSCNAIIRVSAQSISSISFIQGSQAQIIAGRIAASGKASLEFNFYSPSFTKKFFSWPIRATFVLVVVFGLMSAVGLFMGIAGLFFSHHFLK